MCDSRVCVFSYNFAQGNASTGNPNDKVYFIQFLQGLRSTFDEKSPDNRLLLSIAAPASASIVSIGK